MFMNLRGHVGLTLTVLMSVFIATRSRLESWVLFTALSIMTSSLPDIDLRLKLPHRKYTHNLLFILITSIFFGYITSLLLNNFTLGFLSTLSSGLLHLLGDLMTYIGFAPFYPISGRMVALRLFKSDNKFINNLMLFTGMILLTYYVVGMSY